MKNKKEIFSWICAGILPILAFCIVTQIWNVDLKIPLRYGGDLSGLLMNIKTVIRKESWWNFSGLGAPYHTNMWRQLMDAYIPNAIIFIIAKITNQVGYGINFYYILSFGLSGICTYYMLRKTDVCQFYAVIGAIIYALIPGHILRGEEHIYVGSCFAIPLIIVTAVDICKGKVCKLKIEKKSKVTLKTLFNSNSKEQNIGLCFLAIVTLCTIYYGIFSLMLLTFCFLYCIINERRIFYIYYYLQYIIVEIMCIALVYLPMVLANIFDPCLTNISLVTRSRGDVEVYGGKLIQYILPISGHRFQLFSKIREVYDTTFPLNNENGMASLGLIMSIGFLVGIFVSFFDKIKKIERLEVYGKIILFMFVLSTVGGIGAIVGLINYNIRCYNRFSFFIGAVSIIVFLNLLQLIGKYFNTLFNKKMIYVVGVAVLTFALLDQTTVGMIYTKDIGEEMKSQYENDERFVKNIEKIEGKNANILVFPLMNGQQDVLGITKDNYSTRYCHRMLFIHSTTSNWSIGGKAGEESERFINGLENYDISEQVKIATIVGFSGIAVYNGGYEENQLKNTIKKLNEYLGEPTIKNESGEWEYYSLKDYSKQVMDEYSSNEIKKLKEKYLWDSIEFQTVGIYEQEEWGRWAEKKWSLIYNNRVEEQESYIKMTISVPMQNPATLIVKCGKYKKEISISNQTEIELNIPMAKGKNEIQFVSSAPNVMAENDQRNMNIKIFKLKFACGDKEYNVCK